MKKHQIMVFIGNGFDIAVLNKYGKGITTSYDSFYSFFKSEYPNSNKNLLIEQMEKAKSENKENWSDFEAILDEALYYIPNSDSEHTSKLDEDLREIQQAFSRFLNEIIDNDIIENISTANDVIIDSYNNCAKLTFKGSFFRDLSKNQYESMHFHNELDNNEDLKYMFINFNYTLLLDNYLYLNKEMFDPAPYSTSNNNITLDVNPYRYQHSGFNDPYMKLLPIDIIHPHGVQDVPKSLLFGIENKDYCNVRDQRRIFVKSFWAQCQQKYNDKFDSTQLFILYGCSLGKTDSWWWSRIYKRLVDENPAELIIYYYGNEDEDVIKERFIKNCNLKDDDLKDKNKAKEKIYVINFGANTDKDIEFMKLPKIE